MTSASAPRVGVVIIYLGQLPAYFDLTLRSMRMNPQCDFLIFTDQVIPAGNNIQVHPTTLDSLRKRVHAVLGSDHQLGSPYKICDYRPTFGQLFSEEVEKYDYWGHADLDLIFGDMAQTLPLPAIYANKTDKVLIRGNFALYRNVPRMNNLFRTVTPEVDYRRVFRTPEACHFDEWGGIAKLLTPDMRVWSDSLIFDIGANRYRARANDLDDRPTRFYWQDGGLLAHQAGRHPRAGLLIHLQKRPMRRPTPDVLAADRYEIGPSFFRAVPSPNRGRDVPCHVLGAARFWAARGRRRLAQVKLTRSHPT